MTPDWPAEIDDFATRTLRPAANRWSQGAAPETDVFTTAANLGLFAIEVPVAMGGLGLTFAAKAQAVATLAAVDFGFAMSVVNTHNVAARLAQSAAPRVRARYLPGLVSGHFKACTALTEPVAGSDVLAMVTQARPTAEGWVLQGEKTWVVNARDADLALVFARCGDRGIGAFAVDLTDARVQRRPCDSTLSQNSIGSGGFVLKDVVLPSDHLILPPETAFKTILAEINGARIYVAVMLCAMLRAALTEAATLGHTRHTFGAPLSSHQDWRFTLARAQTDLAAAQALTDAAIVTFDRGQDAQLIAAQAKVHTVAMCQHHLPQVLVAMGAAGLTPHNCTPRHLAAVPLAALTDGTSAMLLERISRLSGIATPMKD